MTAIIDAAPLVALGDANDSYYPRVEQLLKAIDGPLVIPAPVTAEVDYLLGTEVGADHSATSSPTSLQGASWSPAWSARTTPPFKTSTRATPTSS